VILSDIAALKSFCKGTIDDPTNNDQLRLRVIAYIDWGDAYVALAENDREAAVSHRGSAREMYQRGLGLMQGLRTGGILDANEVKEIDTVLHKIAQRIPR